MPASAAHYPSQVPITAYGNGGFRFAEMSHQGSLLCLPSGMFAWNAIAAEALLVEHFSQVFAALSAHATLLLGTGFHQVWPDAELTRAFAERRIGLEAMSTGAAARTYNVLLTEKRIIAAALIAVA